MKRADSDKGLLGWINQNDPKQCEWAERYLVSRNFRPRGPASFTDYFEMVTKHIHAGSLQSVEYRDAMTLLIKKMRAAWSAKRNRDKSGGRKAYSYVMSKDIESKLKKLAGKRPINVTLETIINDAFEFFVNNQKEVQLQLRSQSDSHEKLQLYIDKINSQLEYAKHQFETETKKNKIIIDAIKDLYFKLAKQDIILARLGDSDLELNDSEKLEAMKTQEGNFEYFSRSLKAEMHAPGGRRASKI